LFKCPGFEIETIRIHQPGRRAQAERELPALARVQSRSDVVLLGVPIDADMCGYARERCQNAFDVELEAHGALVVLGETRHYTYDGNIAAFPVCAELIGESDVSDQCSPEKSDREADCDCGAALDESRYSSVGGQEEIAARGEHKNVSPEN
jgi:hypothetical protein